MKIWQVVVILITLVCCMFDLLTPASPFTDFWAWIFQAFVNVWAWFQDFFSRIVEAF